MFDHSQAACLLADEDAAVRRNRKRRGRGQPAHDFLHREPRRQRHRANPPAAGGWLAGRAKGLEISNQVGELLARETRGETFGHDRDVQELAVLDVRLEHDVLMGLRRRPA